jgi:signal transduction histidine kinase
MLGVTLFGVDTTAETLARRRAEQEREPAKTAGPERRELDAESFLATVSHDLRNPLNVIFMTSELILRDTANTRPDRMRRHVQGLQRAGERMLHVLQDLLELVRIESVGVRLDVASNDVASLVAGTLELMQPIADERFIHFDVTLEPWNLRVFCDRPRTQRALANLIDNAIKVTPNGGVVRVRIEPVGDEARFSVIDRGPGLPPEQLAAIISRYWRDRPSGHRRPGLGLAIVRALVEAQGGRLDAESQVGAGSTFSFTVKLAPIEPA